MDAEKCQHCHKKKANKPRRLCSACYTTKSVRRQYPSLRNTFNDRGQGNFLKTPPSPIQATDALPNTEEKIAVLAERLRLGQGLWHEGDKKRDLE